MFKTTVQDIYCLEQTTEDSTRDLTVLQEIKKKEQHIKHQKAAKNEDIKGQISSPKFNKEVSNHGTILPAHDSVYEALNHPDLNQTARPQNEEGTGRASIRKLDTDSINGSQFQFHFLKDELKNAEDRGNLDFSVTSWQNISTYFDKQSINEQLGSSNFQIKVPLAFSSDQVNVISSGNNSPTYRNDEILLMGPGRIDSPNAGSILSSSSGQDEEKTLENILREKDPSKKSKLFFEKKMHLGSLSDQEESDTELEKTVDSSTIISSFVMPKVSILSDSNLDSHYLNNRLITRIKIVGDRDGRLLRRFQSYKKTLTNVEFCTSITDVANLIILIVDEDNYMLPRLTKTYCIPIVLSKSKLYLVKKIPKNLKLCGPIILKSLDDNLIHLIDFLSNINDANFWKTFVTYIEKGIQGQSPSISDLNSSLIGFQSQRNGNLENIHEHPTSKDKKRNRMFFNTYVVAGIMVGAISLGMLLFLQKLATDDIHLSQIEQDDPMIMYGPENLESSKNLTLKLHYYLMMGINQLRTDIEEHVMHFCSKSLIYYHKAKLLIYQYFT